MPVEVDFLHPISVKECCYLETHGNVLLFFKFIQLLNLNLFENAWGRDFNFIPANSDCHKPKSLFFIRNCASLPQLRVVKLVNTLSIINYSEIVEEK